MIKKELIVNEVELNDLGQTVSMKDKVLGIIVIVLIALLIIAIGSAL